MINFSTHGLNSKLWFTEKLLENFTYFCKAKTLLSHKQVILQGINISRILDPPQNPSGGTQALHETPPSSIYLVKLA